MKLARAALLLSLFATNVWAQDDESYSSYDSIVDELTADANYEPAPSLISDWEEVALQGGMSFITSVVSVEDPGTGFAGSGVMTGVEGHAGANLFSRKLRAEISFRNYMPKDMDTAQIDLKEIESRLVLLPRVSGAVKLRMGFGLAARFVTFTGRMEDGALLERNARKIASSVFLGFEHKLSKGVSVGPDIAYRSGLTSSAIDKSAWDAAIRLNATF